MNILNGQMDHQTGDRNATLNRARPFDRAASLDIALHVAMQLHVLIACSYFQ